MKVYVQWEVSTSDLHHSACLSPEKKVSSFVKRVKWEVLVVEADSEISG